MGLGQSDTLLSDGASTEGALDKLLWSGYVTSHSSPPRMPFYCTILGVRLDLLLILPLPGLCDPRGPQSLLITDGWEGCWQRYPALNSISSASQGQGSP